MSLYLCHIHAYTRFCGCSSMRAMSLCEHLVLPGFTVSALACVFVLGVLSSRTFFARTCSQSVAEFSFLAFGLAFCYTLADPPCVLFCGRASSTASIEKKLERVLTVVSQETPFGPLGCVVSALFFVQLCAGLQVMCCHDAVVQREHFTACAGPRVIQLHHKRRFC